jgi:hypothetical protein
MILQLESGRIAPERPPRRKPERAPSKRTRSGGELPVAGRSGSVVAEPAWKGCVDGIPVLNLGAWKIGIPVASASFVISFTACDCQDSGNGSLEQ